MAMRYMRAEKFPVGVYSHIAIAYKRDTYMAVLAAGTTLLIEFQALLWLFLRRNQSVHHKIHLLIFEQSLGEYLSIVSRNLGLRKFVP